VTARCRILLGAGDVLDIVWGSPLAVLFGEYGEDFELWRAQNRLFNGSSGMTVLSIPFAGYIHAAQIALAVELEIDRRLQEAAPMTQAVSSRLAANGLYNVTVLAWRSRRQPPGSIGPRANGCSMSLYQRSAPAGCSPRCVLAATSLRRWCSIKIIRIHAQNVRVKPDDIITLRYTSHTLSSRRGVAKNAEVPFEGGRFTLSSGAWTPRWASRRPREHRCL
jgi:hypothetical protein